MAQSLLLVMVQLSLVVSAVAAAIVVTTKLAAVAIGTTAHWCEEMRTWALIITSE